MMLSTVWFGLSVIACCSLAGPIGRLLGVIDHPDGGRKSHARPTPMVGGIALMVPLLLVNLAIWYGGGPAIYRTLAVGIVGFLLLGWYDDRHHVQPALRLVISTGLFGALILLEPALALTELDFRPSFVLGLSIAAFPFTLLCLVGLQNSINMVDGMNGLLIGLSIFWTGCLLLYAPQDLSLYLSFMMLGLIILMGYNLAGVLFLGDAGSYSIGATIGVLMISCYQSAEAALPMVTVVLWLLIPVVDCLRVMVARLIHGRSPLMADKNHLHHRLARQWRWPVCLAVYLAIVIVPGSIGALWPHLSVVMIVLLMTCYGGLLWITRSGHVAQGSPELI